MNSTDRMKAKFAAASASHMGRLDSIAELGRIKASMLAGGVTDTGRFPAEYEQVANVGYTPVASCAEFTQDIDKAMGIEPQAAWPMIAELYDAHGWSAWYDLGVICVMMLGVGVMYLSSISRYSV